MKFQLQVNSYCSQIVSHQCIGAIKKKIWGLLRWVIIGNTCTYQLPNRRSKTLADWITWITRNLIAMLSDLFSSVAKRKSPALVRLPSTKFVFFGPIGKTRWPPWPLVCRDIFDFSSETAEPNSTKFDRKQDLKALYQVCVFPADRKNKMAAPVSDWLRHLRLLL